MMRTLSLIVKETIILLALQNIPALLYFCKLVLTFTVQRGSLFVAIACGTEHPREQGQRGTFC